MQPKKPGCISTVSAIVVPTVFIGPFIWAFMACYLEKRESGFLVYSIIFMVILVLVILGCLWSSKVPVAPSDESGGVGGSDGGDGLSPERKLFLGLMGGYLLDKARKRNQGDRDGSDRNGDLDVHGDGFDDCNW